jgi:hypothetical protein
VLEGPVRRLGVGCWTNLHTGLSPLVTLRRPSRAPRRRRRSQPSAAAALSATRISQRAAGVPRPPPRRRRSGPGRQRASARRAGSTGRWPTRSSVPRGGDSRGQATHQFLHRPAHVHGQADHQVVAGGRRSPGRQVGLDPVDALSRVCAEALRAGPGVAEPDRTCRPWSDKGTRTASAGDAHLPKLQHRRALPCELGASEARWHDGAAASSKRRKYASSA